MGTGKVGGSGGGGGGSGGVRTQRLDRNRIRGGEKKKEKKE